MKECFKCGVWGDKAILFDAISGEGIVKICKTCSFDEGIPIIKKPTSFQISKTKNDKNPSVYERLSNISGINLKNQKSKEKEELLKKQGTTLRNIIDKNFETTLQEKPEPRHDLIDNFHWIIMRVRRLKKLTQEQLAKTIGEPEAAIKMVEKGILPENNYKLINKIENYLEIKLVKKESGYSKIQEAPPPKEKEIPVEIKFDPITSKTLTISDLQEMKKKKEAEILGDTIEEDYVFNEKIDLNPENSEEQPEFIKKNKEDLSEEDIRDLVFRR